MKWFLAFIVCSVITIQLCSQDPTVGVLQNTEASLDGYTLITPTSSKTTFLIDNCGHVVNEWHSNYIPGMVAYLQEDGRLIRACRIIASFSSGGSGGRLEMFSWDDELIWSIEIADETQHLHHDIAIMPNGNILVVSWDKRPNDEIIEAGRDPNSIGPSGVWYEKILELKPIGIDSTEIVWEWYLFDHLVQDYDSTQQNYGIIADHPRKMDINYHNYLGNNPGQGDWFHMNAIDYNPDLDQIAFSSRSTNEIYIIDHSTTTAEAASGIGGNSGLGGDFLYRWGNPEVYQRGNTEDQKLFGQHDVHWVDAGLPDEGKIMIFNNGVNRPDGDYSSIEIIDPPSNGFGYDLDNGMPFEPEESFVRITGEGETAFYSSRISGAQQLPNKNILICSGNEGRILEIDSMGNLVWDFVNPVNQFGSAAQGQTPFSNDMFRAYRYASDYPAFKDRILFPGPPIESNPWPDNCVIYNNSVSTIDNPLEEMVSIFPNPATGFISFDNRSEKQIQIQIINSFGQIQDLMLIAPNQTIQKDVTHYTNGIYFVNIGNGQTLKIVIAN